VLTGLTLRRPGGAGSNSAAPCCCLGALTTIMLLLSPVCHLHNLTLSCCWPAVW